MNLRLDHCLLTYTRPSNTYGLHILLSSQQQQAREAQEATDPPMAATEVAARASPARAAQEATDPPMAATEVAARASPARAAQEATALAVDMIPRQDPPSPVEAEDMAPVAEDMAPVALASPARAAEEEGTALAVDTCGISRPRVNNKLFASPVLLFTTLHQACHPS